MEAVCAETRRVSIPSLVSDKKEKENERNIRNQAGAT